MPMATPDQVAQWTTWLLAARSAYHDLMTGAQVVEVSIDGGTQVTKFARSDATRLKAYIAELEAMIANASVCAGPLKGAIGAFF